MFNKQVQDKPKAPASIGDLLKTAAPAAAPANAPVSAGMQSSGLGANTVVEKAPAPKVVKDYSSVHVSKLNGAAGQQSGGRFCWSKEAIDEKCTRLRALIKSGRVIKHN